MAVETCKSCGRALTAQGSGRRRRIDSEYCSDRCRQKHYRRRKATEAARDREIADLIERLIG